MSAAKKSKLMTDEAELEAVRRYLLECPSVSKDSRAIQVSLQALDQERKRMERDAKLQRKFAANKAKSTAEAKQKASTTTSTSTNPTTTRQKTSKNTTAVEDDELMEWQDVDASREAVHEAEGSVLGKLLAQSAIASMAHAQTTVASPLGAVALAIHAALCSDVLDFKCTGIPSDSSSSSAGFAAPIRELPKTQLVPEHWDEHAQDATTPYVKLRYRKQGMGSTILNVLLKKEQHDMVHVELLPTNAKEPSSTFLEFPLEEHVNVESLSKALKAEQHRVVPTLHYKALPVLLTNMCRVFDLGPIKDVGVGDEASSEGLPYVDTTIVHAPDPLAVSQQQQQQQQQPPYRVYDPHEPPSIRQFQPPPHRGDFDADLMPGGIMDPLGAGGGNLMGPNHPMFGQPATGGGYGMRPRFDPFGPPGGPTDPRNIDDDNPDNDDPRQPRPQRPRPPPGGTGDPNPDHERKPNNLSNNMFM